jgi:hypothetical protein
MEMLWLVGRICLVDMVSLIGMDMKASCGESGRSEPAFYFLHYDMVGREQQHTGCHPCGGIGKASCRMEECIKEYTCSF